MADPRRQAAQVIYQQGLHAGLAPARALELVAAAQAESGLDPHATNRSSGAAGLFQLLSAGYRQRAQQSGGLYDPVANTRAILPDYVSYWRQHPQAAPGEAAAGVERSGQGAGFYSHPISLASTLIGGGGPASAPVVGAVAGAPQRSPARAIAASPTAAPPTQPNVAGTDLRRQLALALLQGGDVTQAAGRLAQARASSALAPAAATPQPAPAFHPNEPLPQAAQDPVRGATVIQSPFKLIGRPYQGTHTLGNWESDQAVDLAVPVGTPLYAAFSGTIGPQFGSLGEGGRFAGLRLHLQGPGDELYYAHLSRFAPGIKPGAQIQAGQLLGFSGSANGVPHLHLGDRTGHVVQSIMHAVAA